MHTISPFLRAEKEGGKSFILIREMKANCATAAASTPIILPVTIAARNRSRRILAIPIVDF